MTVAHPPPSPPTAPRGEEEIIRSFGTLTGSKIHACDRQTASELVAEGIGLEIAERGIREAVEATKPQRVLSLGYCVERIRNLARTAASTTVGEPQTSTAFVPPGGRHPQVAWLEDPQLERLVTALSAWRQTYYAEHGRVNPTRAEGRAFLLPWAADHNIPLDLVDRWYPESEGGL